MSAAELERLGAVIDTSGVAERIEARLPVGVRRRQLRVRTLVLGALLVAADHRPMFVRNIHKALLGLPAPAKRRLGIVAAWETGEHLLTYRQVERTVRLVRTALSKKTPDGAPSELLQDVLDSLLEASVQASGEPRSDSLAVDWTDLETWARPPRRDGRCGDPDAAWGHRTTNHPAHNETFFGYYLQPLTTVPDERGPDVPELVRRVHIAGCQHDPPARIVPVLRNMHQHEIPIADLLADCGYSYRQPETFALPVRALGTQLIIDLHPGDRGAKGTHMGAIIANGRLYCPATPTTLLELSPLPPGATDEQAATHDRRCAELAKYKLSPITAPDNDGYQRVSCPATNGKLRCPLRPDSMTLSHERPTILDAPEHPPVCCTQKTITVPPQVNAKTAQKHDWPSPQHRRSYNRRTAAERTNASVKDPATTNLARGFCRLTGLAAISLLTTCMLAARNLRIADAFNQRQAHAAHRTNGHHTTRPRRRQQTIQHLLAATNSSP